MLQYEPILQKLLRVYFFTGFSSFLPERLRHDLLWNRTVNLIGGIGENIAADLANRFMNKFKCELIHFF